MSRMKSKKLPTLEELREAIPEECFQKSLSLSLAYLVLDFALIFGLYLIVPYVEALFGWIGLVLWYYVVGMFAMSLFVVGHDCGHGTFSNYTWINDLCGHVAHSPLQAPYWPWQKSHRKHHQHTSHIEKDLSHPWITEEQFNSWSFVNRHFRKIPISGLFLWQLYTQLGIPDGSHFYPFSSLFSNNFERVQCVISALSCWPCSYIALVLCDYDIFAYFKYYYVPLLFFSLWLMVITFFQHKDEEIEAYKNEWSYVRGQSQTIDRRYGFGIDALTHHITDSHVVHHFFFTGIPHYHLPKATEAIKRVMEKYPGVYKQQSTYDHLYQFLRLNIKLDYMITKGAGIFKYRVSKDFKKAD
ncbi:Omega-6 fatty acid desaturase, endoplasmic reticulum isozyme 1 [Aphelenchoides bicaudatus]|nr:Omega-6 fatty acid desaturase, endoplasmic reticulum isozyme 1 [Aphelenchoides bicaudatus]